MARRAFGCRRLDLPILGYNVLRKTDFRRIEKKWSSKMTNTLFHKGFIGTVQFSTEDDCFFGRIEGIDDLVTLEGTMVSALKKALKMNIPHS